MKSFWVPFGSFWVNRRIAIFSKHHSVTLDRFRKLHLRDHSDHLAFFRRTLETRLGSKRMKNARFEQFGGRFEVV